MALVIAACIFIGELIAALTYFLRGEITSRFLAKAFVVLVISGGVFYMEPPRRQALFCLRFLTNGEQSAILLPRLLTSAEPGFNKNAGEIAPSRADLPSF